MKSIRLSIAFALLLSAFSPALCAQTATGPADRDFDLQTLHPAPGAGSFLTVEGARVDEHMGYSVGGIFGFQYRPLGISTPNGSYALMKYHGSLDLLGSYSIYKIFEIGLALPVIYYQAGEDVYVNGTVVEEAPGAVAGLGDPRLHLKLDLLNPLKTNFENFGLAFILVTSFPVGNAIAPDDFIGDSMLTVNPKLAFESSVWRFRFGLNAGYLWREYKEFYSGEVGQRITFGFATEALIINDLKAMLEMFGENGFSSGAKSTPLEMYGGLKYQVYKNLWLTFAAGAGMSIGNDTIDRGMGAPTVRGLVGIKWEPEIKHDPDNDGLLDTSDQCPDAPEDVDGFQDEDGCPDEDNDNDGIPDASDKCRDKPEDMDKFEDEDGCPEGDNDADGVDDTADRCPTVKEDRDGFEDNDGCPDEDNDSDGIPDAKDACPDKAETVNGHLDDDGCPDQKPKLIEVKGEKIELKQKVFFDPGKSVVLRQSFELLDEIALVLLQRNDLRIRIEGHTDNVGSPEQNRELSRKRAQAVKDYLVHKGIAPSRLTVEGVGPDKPIAPNTIAEGRAANRRVEFIIVE